MVLAMLFAVMPSSSSLATQLGILGVHLPAWPEEPAVGPPAGALASGHASDPASGHASDHAGALAGGWIQRGRAYAEGVRLWRAQLRNAPESSRTVVDQLLRHLHDTGQLGVWDQLVYAAIKPEVQGGPDYERWQTCTKLIRSSALTPAQLLGMALEMAREQRLAAATYGIRRLVKEHPQLRPEEQLEISADLVATASTDHLIKDAAASNAGWLRAMAVHEQWSGLLGEAMAMVQEQQSAGEVAVEHHTTFVKRLDSISDCLGSKGAHGHAVFIELCHNYVPKLVAEWQGEPLWIVEVGCSREIIEGQHSTGQLLATATDLGLRFAGIDIDADNISALKRDYGEQSARWISQKGEDALKDWTQPIAACYLDAYDFFHKSHSDVRQDVYIINYGQTVNDAECHQMHLDAAIHASVRIPAGGLLGLDDTWLENGQWAGKGAMAMPWLLAQGWQLLSKSNRGTVLRKPCTQRSGEDDAMISVLRQAHEGERMIISERKLAHKDALSNVNT